MNAQQKVLLLIGSAKSPGTSTSEALGLYLCRRLVDKGWRMQTLYVHRSLRTANQSLDMLRAVDMADLVILAAPLYVDSLPYLVTDAMERIAAHRSANAAGAPPRFMAIINCGFPEAQHNDVAVSICRQFSHAANLQWAGALSLGGGGFVHGSTPDTLGPRAKGIVSALDATADALAKTQPVPEQAVTAMAEPAIPPWLYTTFGNIGWHHTSWKQGAHSRLWDRPFADNRNTESSSKGLLSVRNG